MFTLELEPPSIDGLGVKRWRCGYLVGGSQLVELFERPRASLPTDRDPRWMLRITNRSGDHVETRLYKTRSGVRERLGRLFNARAVIVPERQER